MDIAKTNSLDGDDCEIKSVDKVERHDERVDECAEGDVNEENDDDDDKCTLFAGEAASCQMKLS